MVEFMFCYETKFIFFFSDFIDEATLEFDHLKLKTFECSLSLSLNTLVFFAEKKQTPKIAQSCRRH